MSNANLTKDKNISLLRLQRKFINDNNKIWTNAAFLQVLYVLYPPRLCIKRSQSKKTKKKKIKTSPDGLEPPTFRLAAERTSRLRHGDLYGCVTN